MGKLYKNISLEDPELLENYELIENPESLKVKNNKLSFKQLTLLTYTTMSIISLALAIYYIAIQIYSHNNVQYSDCVLLNKTLLKEDVNFKIHLIKINIDGNINIKYDYQKIAQKNYDMYEIGNIYGCYYYENDLNIISWKILIYDDYFVYIFIFLDLFVFSIIILMLING